MKNRKKHLSKILVITLTGSILFCENGSTVLAASPSAKEEVVYAMLDASGEVTGVYVVNSFTDKDITDYGDYTDIRNLTTTDEISNDNGTITLHTDADKVYYQGNLETTDIPWNISITYKIDGKEYSPEEIAGMSGELELHISITQNTACDTSFWDGYALQATITLDGNNCNNLVADNATIANVGSNKQLSYIILPGKETEISVTADVADFEMDSITINGIKLNLNLEIDDSELTDKVSEIQDAVNELNDGASALNNGAGDLNDGAAKLNRGIKAVQEGLDALNKQSSTLTNGSGQILNGLETIQSSLNNVSINANDLTTLSNSSTQIKAGIDALVGGLQTADNSIGTYYSSLSSAGITNVDDYVSKHKQAISALNISSTQRALYQAYVSGGDAGVTAKLGELVQAGDSEATALYQQVSAGNSSAVTSYVTTAGTLISMESLLSGDIAYIQGSNSLIQGLDSSLDSKNGALMSGALSLQSNYKIFDENIQELTSSLISLTGNMASLKNGIDTLVANYQTLDGGINTYTDAVAKIVAGYHTIYEGSTELAQGTSDLYEGTSNLYDGTQEFYSQTVDMDTQISDTIDTTIEDLTGKNIETVSFVSDKNTNVESVLFVMKTPAIEKKEVEETVEEEPESLSLGQKFLKLFGID